MDKKELLKSFNTPEEKLLFSKVLDRLFFCQKEFRKAFTDFIDPVHADKMKRLLERRINEKIMIYGGAPECERVMVGFAPEYETLEASEFPIGRLLVKYSEKFNPSLGHRDFLGSILGLGLDRGKIGDILIKGGEAEVFACANELGFICANLEKVGRSRVSAKIMPESASPIWEMIPELRPDDSTQMLAVVSSLRIDAVISAAFKVSRNASLELVKSGKVSVNWSSASDPSKTVKEADIMSVRGMGRIHVAEILGETSKGRWRIRVLKYN
ncbi:MAG: hypothetical protein LBU32_12630 [Clostridiales bacterium]|jgi:RNA-binding protein YlmH|nr:hypothetical protein [Clostridiales bacterium]